MNKGNTYNLGKHLTEDTKRALSSSLKEKWKDENYVTKVKEALHRVMTSTDYRLKQAKLSTGGAIKLQNLML